MKTGEITLNDMREIVSMNRALNAFALVAFQTAYSICFNDDIKDCIFSDFSLLPCAPGARTVVECLHDVLETNGFVTHDEMWSIVDRKMTKEQADAICHRIIKRGAVYAKND